MLSLKLIDGSMKSKTAVLNSFSGSPALPIEKCGVVCGVPSVDHGGVQRVPT